jgi:hypothetical protein
MLVGVVFELLINPSALLAFILPSKHGKKQEEIE